MGKPVAQTTNDRVRCRACGDAGFVFVTVERPVSKRVFDVEITALATRTDWVGERQIVECGCRDLEHNSMRDRYLASRQPVA
jgi:hypothetical protein